MTAHEEALKTIEFLQPIYTFHIDSGQHVSNIAYIKWMEIGRLKLLESAGLPVHRIIEHGFIPVLTRTEINYKQPLVLGDEVKIILWISDLKRISATLIFNFLNQRNELVAEGVQTALFVNVDNQRPYKLPIEDRARFEPYVRFQKAMLHGTN